MVVPAHKVMRLINFNACEFQITLLPVTILTLCECVCSRTYTCMVYGIRYDNISEFLKWHRNTKNLIDNI